MNYLQTFTRTFWHSLTNPAYYRDVLKVSASFSWKYFLVFNVLVAVISGSLLFNRIWRFEPDRVVNQVLTMYPDDLIISYEAGELTVNQPLPYEIAMPAGGGDADLSNIVTFTSDQEFRGIPAFESYRSVAVVTESTLYVLDDDSFSQVRAIAIGGGNEDWEVSQPLLRSAFDQILDHPFIADNYYLWAILAGLLILWYPVRLVASIMMVLVFTFIAWVLISIFSHRRDLPYGQVFKLGLHASTLPLILSLLLAGLDLSYGQFPLPGLALVAWLFVISRSLPIKKGSRRR